MRTFELNIVSTTKVHFSDEARFCSITTPFGTIGFEARHEPFLAVLKEDSEVKYRDAIGREHTLPVTNGLLSFRNNTCTVTVEPRTQE